ncbi:MAG: acyltransferase [Clostridia bacterium]|nr:acyltransferase [Clostridia bacterium]
MGLLGVWIHKYKMARKPVAYLRSLGVKIGEHCSIASNVQFGSEPYMITIGDHVRLTENVRLVTHDGGLWVVRELKEEYKNADIFKPIVIGNNVHVGVNSIIMPGVTIGNNVIIGCGAVVTKDIPDNSVAVGVPAKVIETVDEYIEKNNDKYIYTKNLSFEEKRKILEKK